MQEIMSSSLPSTSAGKPNITPSTNQSRLTKITEDMVPDNQPETPNTAPRVVKPHMIPLDNPPHPSCP